MVGAMKIERKKREEREKGRKNEESRMIERKSEG